MDTSAKYQAPRKTPATILKGHMETYLHQILLGLACLMIVDVLQLFIPMVLKDAINYLTQIPAGLKGFFRYPTIIIGLALAIAVFRYLWRYFILGQARALERDLRATLYGHIQGLPMRFWEKKSVGDLMARSTNDLNALRMAAGMGFVALIDGVLLGIAAVIFMLSINASLTLMCLLPMPLIALFTKLLTKRMSKAYEVAQREFSNLTERAREAIAGIKVLKAFSQEDWGYSKISGAGENYLRINLRLSRYVGLFLPLTGIFTNLALAVLIAYGGRKALLQELDTGEFVAFVAYLGILTWPMMAIGWVANLAQRAKIALNRIVEVLNEPQEDTRPASLPAPAQEIHMRSLHFSYGQGAFYLDIPYIRIPMGKTTAFVGKIGSGKTTLLHLITRLIEPPPNTLFYGDMDALNIPLRSWRSMFGYAPQDGILFSDTIAENIRFGRSETQQVCLKGLLQISGLSLDQDMEDAQLRFLNELGSNISGGQRQRVSLARALYGDPPILILDDALSMVDLKTEGLIIEHLLSARRDKTNIVVSHRVSVLSRVDYIYVLDSNTVKEQGTHHELMNMKGIYYSIYQREIMGQYAL